jgi:hypothetical protein
MRALICHQAQPRWKTLCMMKPQRVYLMQRMNSRGVSSAWGTCLRACAGLCNEASQAQTWCIGSTQRLLRHATSCTCKHVCGRSA